MSVRWKVTIFYGYVVACLIGSMWLAGARTGLYAAILWLSAGAVSFFVRCPKCGKSVFSTERRRNVGMSIGYMHIWPETICSRCRTPLFPRT